MFGPRWLTRVSAPILMTRMQRFALPNLRRRDAAAVPAPTRDPLGDDDPDSCRLRQRELERRPSLVLGLLGCGAREVGRPSAADHEGAVRDPIVREPRHDLSSRARSASSSPAHPCPRRCSPSRAPGSCARRPRPAGCTSDRSRRGSPRTHCPHDRNAPTGARSSSDCSNTNRASRSTSCPGPRAPRSTAGRCSREPCLLVSPTAVGTELTGALAPPALLADSATRTVWPTSEPVNV